MSNTYFRNFKSRTKSDAQKRWQNLEPRKKTLNVISKAEPENVRLQTTDAKEEMKSAFGYFFQSDAQNLAVTMPGDMAPVTLGSQTIVSGFMHDPESPDIVVMQDGLYEINYVLIVKAAMAVQATLLLQTDGKTIEGSVTTKTLGEDETVYSATTRAQLKADSVLRLVMTSGSVISIGTPSGGINASVIVKKLD